MPIVLKSVTRLGSSEVSMTSLLSMSDNCPVTRKSLGSEEGLKIVSLCHELHMRRNDIFLVSQREGMGVRGRKEGGLGNQLAGQLG